MKHSDHVVSERKVLAHLSRLKGCRFIMHFYSSFQDDHNLYLELEYIQGCTLLSQILY